MTLSELWKPDVVIYHANCFDGMAAAWAAWRKWGDEGIQYIAADYGQTPPDVTNKNVLIVDFSYKQAVLEDMGKTATRILILDHHESAEKDLSKYNLGSFPAEPLTIERFTRSLDMGQEIQTGRNIFAVFDMTRSGAMLTWEFCHSTKNPPLLIQWIQDRDLWRFELEGSREFGVYLSTEEFSIEKYDRIHDELSYHDSRCLVIEQANAMYKLFTQNVKRFASHAEWYTIDGHIVIGVNCPLEYRSEVGNYLAEEYPESPFSITFYDSINGRKWSLRSLKGKFNVSEVAVKFGGGGHPEAASFNTSLDETA